VIPPEQQEELNALFGHKSELDLADCVTRFLTARARKEEMEAGLRQSRLDLEAAEKALLVALSAAEETTVDFRSYRLSVAKSRHFALVPEALDSAFTIRWIMRNGGHDLVKRSVDPRQFSHFCRALAEKGVVLPYIIREFVRTVIQVHERKDENLKKPP